MGMIARAVKNAGLTVGGTGFNQGPMWGWFGQGDRARSITGLNVTPQTALTNMAVWGAVTIISQDVASLPLHIYRRRPNGGKDRATDHPSYRMLHDIANPRMTSMVFRETLTGHILTWGNGYAEMVPNGTGQIVEMWPLRPDRMGDPIVERGEWFYPYQTPDGQVQVLPASRVFHVPGFGFDGVKGYAPIAMARRAIEVAQAAEEFGGRFFQADARPGIALMHPGKLGKEGRKNLRESWDEAHQGLSNAHRTAVLEEGVSIKDIGFPPEDAQFIETRKFGVLEVARLYRLSPHKLAQIEDANRASTEESNLEHVGSTLRSYLVRWEQQIGKDVLHIADVPDYFAEHLLDALLRGKTLERYQALQVMRQNGAINGDEWREIENMNPIEDGSGKVYWRPANMTDASKEPEPAPDPVPPVDPNAEPVPAPQEPKP